MAELKATLVMDKVKNKYMTVTQMCMHLEYVRWLTAE